MPNSSTPYYDAIAKGYDELYGEEQHKKISIILRELQQKGVRGKLLDVGCGTGFSLDLVHQATGLQVVGVEPSPNMAEQYKGPHTLLVCDASHMPFADETFDAVMSVTAIHHFEHLEQGVDNMRRVTKREGYLFISCLKKSDRFALVCRVLADHLTILDMIEEEKDVVFVCRRT